MVASLTTERDSLLSQLAELNVKLNEHASQADRINQLTTSEITSQQERENLLKKLNNNFEEISDLKNQLSSMKTKETMLEIEYKHLRTLYNNNQNNPSNPNNSSSPDKLEAGVKSEGSEKGFISDNGNRSRHEGSLE